MGVTREKNMQKFIALCALCAFASALPSGFHNDVILGRRAAKAVTTPCGCFSSACKVTAPTNGGMGDCKDTMADGSTCTPTCGSDYTKVGTTYTCSKTSLSGVSCQGKPCAISSGAAVTPAGATATGACNTLITAKSMNSGASCGFTCPANKVVDKTTTCSATALTLGSCKASYCDGVDTYAKASDAGAGGAGDCGKTLALGGTCTPATKTGYTCTGKVTCSSTSVANTKGTKTENFQCTAKQCTGLSAPANGKVGDCTSTLNSGSTCTPTCDSGYTKVGTTRSCLAGTVTDVKCEKDCTTVLAKPTTPAGITFTGGTCTVGGTLKGGATCTWGTPNAGNTCSAVKCTGGSLTGGTCAKTTCDFSAVPTNGAVGDCTKTIGGGSSAKSCTPTCNSGYTASGTRTCGVNGVTPAVGAAGTTSYVLRTHRTHAQLLRPTVQKERAMPPSVELPQLLEQLAQLPAMQAT